MYHNINFVCCELCVRDEMYVCRLLGSLVGWLVAGWFVVSSWCVGAVFLQWTVSLVCNAAGMVGFGMNV